jgi:glycosyltransferase involved in cell wall biosynthesis
MAACTTPLRRPRPGRSERLTILSVAYPLAQVGHDAAGGAEQVLTAIDEALVRAGHRSIVIAAEGSLVAGTLVKVPAETATIDSSVRERAWSRHRQAIAGTLAREPIDLVHVHGVDFHEYLPAVAPTLVTLHLPLSWYPAKAWRKRPGLWFNCVSKAQERETPVPVVLRPPVPNGVPVAELAARHARRRFALMIARLCPEKGIHLGLQAAARAGMPLLVGGRLYPYPEHQAYFRDSVEPLLDARRRWIGPLAFVRKRRLLTAAWCLLVPSLAETSSLVAMEAAACGTPVIAFRRGALEEIVEDGRTGFLVRDVEEMAEAIGLTDTIDADICRAAARRRFSIEHMTARYLALFEELAFLARSATAS